VRSAADLDKAYQSLTIAIGCNQHLHDLLNMHGRCERDFGTVLVSINILVSAGRRMYVCFFDLAG
jgi:hypothetical protein